MAPIRIKLNLAHLGRDQFALSFPPSDDPRYSIKGEDSVHIDPGNRKDSYPVSLELELNLPIVGIGFSTDRDVTYYHEKGHCGGCFSLEDDIPSTGATSVLILDDPKDDDPIHYFFGIEPLGGKVGGGIDPQIYNEGVGDPPSWWRRLWAWLRS